MVNQRGKLIVIAGIDGSGKATQAALLHERVRAAGRRAEIFDFPQYGQSLFADMVAAYLRGEYGPAENVDARLASLMYAGDRWCAKPRLEGLLREGVVVICNRYVCANKAHQGGKILDARARHEFYAWVDKLEFELYGMPRPDLSILLHVPPDVAQKLVDAKGRRDYLGAKARDAHEANFQHLVHAAAAYEELPAREPNWARVDCVVAGALLPPEVIAERVWEHVQPRL